jgi:hypothetical protein
MTHTNDDANTLANDYTLDELFSMADTLTHSPTSVVAFMADMQCRLRLTAPRLDAQAAQALRDHAATLTEHEVNVLTRIAAQQYAAATNLLS